MTAFQSSFTSEYIGNSVTYAIVEIRFVANMLVCAYWHKSWTPKFYSLCEVTGCLRSGRENTSRLPESASHSRLQSISSCARLHLAGPRQTTHFNNSHRFWAVGLPQDRSVNPPTLTTLLVSLGGWFY